MEELIYIYIYICHRFLEINERVGPFGMAEPPFGMAETGRALAHQNNGDDRKRAEGFKSALLLPVNT